MKKITLQFLQRENEKIHLHRVQQATQHLLYKELSLQQEFCYQLIWTGSPEFTSAVPTAELQVLLKVKTKAL